MEILFLNSLQIHSFTLGPREKATVWKFPDQCEGDTFSNLKASAKWVEAVGPL